MSPAAGALRISSGPDVCTTSGASACGAGAIASGVVIQRVGARDCAASTGEGAGAAAVTGNAPLDDGDSALVSEGAPCDPDRAVDVVTLHCADTGSDGDPFVVTFIVAPTACCDDVVTESCTRSDTSFDAPLVVGGIGCAAIAGFAIHRQAPSIHIH